MKANINAYSLIFLGLFTIGGVTCTPLMLAQERALVPAAEADPDYYGNLREEPISQILSRFNEKYADEAAHYAQPKLTLSELKGALILAMKKAKGDRRRTLKRVFRHDVVPPGTKLILEIGWVESIGGRAVNVDLWNVEMEFGITIPDDPGIERIATPEEMARRWSIPIRLVIFKSVE